MAKFLGKSIIDCYRYFYEGNVFAPYFALLQSSGTGKTTCMRLIENLFPTRYINLGPKNYRTEYDKNYLNQLIEISKDVNGARALYLMKELLLTCVNDLQEPLFFEGYQESEHFSKGEYLKTGIRCICLDEVKILCETPTCCYKTGEERNIFKLLRVALANLGRAHKIVLVVADTDSAVANFAIPSPYRNLSRHITELPNHHLFPVVFHMPFSDLKITEIQKNELEKPEFSMKRLSLYGRPLWSNGKLKPGLLHQIERKLVYKQRMIFKNIWLCWAAD